jgi:beta-N-acetylhexosaminidase
VVDASRAALAARDFAPFRVNSDMPMAMTAHVVFTALDPHRPATTSRPVIRQVIRGEIGFDGLLMTDDLSMKALSGDFSDRARDALAAGCDVVLHCNGHMAEMAAVASGAKPLTGAAARRARAALGRLAKAPEPFDVDAGRARFAAAFEGRWAA